jgi:two-component system phosphate regulon sensor histidine kinase PhoR
MDNHRHRPEVEQAMLTGIGHAIRFSRTLQLDMLYVALAVGSHPLGGYVRVALPLTEVHRRIATLEHDLLKGGLAALLVAFAVAWLAVRKINKPLQSLTLTARAIGEGRYQPSVLVRSRDEFGELARTFDDMAGRITDKVRELSRERTQLAAILSALIEGVVAIDAQGCVLFLNPTAEHLFDVKAGQIKGRPWREVLRQSPFSAVLKQALEERKSITQEVSIFSPEEHVISVQALPVAYDQGETGVLAALHDVTELRRLTRVRQEFVANVSHELKTPLTAIQGYVETLQAGALSDPAHNKEFIQIIKEHAEHLSSLIDDVLDLSAIEAKRVEYRFEPVSLGEITQRILKGLAPMAKTKGVHIDTQLSESLPKVRADREKLAQILMNLIDNAIKFNNKGGSVRIQATAGGGKMTFSVQDTGRGISPEDLPRIFERFYRSDKARSHEITGTGLGLAIVKHLVEAHQGTVQVESQLGHGSTFTVTLPLA